MKIRDRKKAKRKIDRKKERLKPLKMLGKGHLKEYLSNLMCNLKIAFYKKININLNPFLY
jgi:hypothetical protein